MGRRAPRASAIAPEVQARATLNRPARATCVPRRVARQRTPGPAHGMARPPRLGRRLHASQALPPVYRLKQLNLTNAVSVSARQVRFSYEIDLT